MSLKNRIKFTVAGQHSLLDFVRNHLIFAGFALVPWDEEPDFALVGAEIEKGVHPPVMDLEILAARCTSVPIVLLSSSAIYADSNWTWKHEFPFTETQTSFYTPTPGLKESNRALYALLAEHLFVGSTNAPVLIIRPFNLFGPNMHKGVVYAFVQQAKRHEPLTINGSGYQVRSFLHEEDFLDAYDRVLSLFLRTKQSLIYNIGSEEPITIKRLADTVWSLTHKPGEETPVVQTYAPMAYKRYKVPDVTKLKTDTKWQPKITLRSAILHNQL